MNKSALKNLVAHQEQVKKSRKIFGRKDNNNYSNFKTEKRVRMSREAKGDGRSVGFKTTPTPERPQTARSIFLIIRTDRTVRMTVVTLTWPRSMTALPPPPRATADHPSLPTREYIAENEQATYQNGEGSGSEEECSGEIQECQK